MDDILIVYLHGIGDHLLATPAIHAYRKQHPDTRITLMTLNDQTYRDLWSTNKDIHRVISSSLTINPRYGHPLFLLHDYWIIRHDIKKADQCYHFSRIHFVTHYFLPAFFYSFLSFLPRYSTHKCFLIARQLGVPLAICDYLFSLPPSASSWATQYLKKNNLSRPLVGVHFNGSSPSKSLPYSPAEKIMELLLSRGYRVLVFNSPSSYKNEKHHHGGTHVTNVVSSDILQTAALLDACDFFIGVDSGIAHLAGALDKKVFCIYFRSIWSLNSAVLGSKATLFVFNPRTLFDAVVSFERSHTSL